MSGSNAEYMREWRKTPAGKAALENQRKRERARTHAMNRLIATYPTVWETFLKVALKIEGIDD
jgi:hypothetical protein